ncbi:pathogenesis-related protein 1A-like [Arachis duranensis]|uniref:Pathogenesis-related protein 1A-like n=1 Tax=Arachis duranensis TaxID=130453 RepID=A0A6P4BJQ0_ARADU|nr:pathogenesis-related protein 1A-like [Arachis duranensis]
MAQKMTKGIQKIEDTEEKKGQSPNNNRSKIRVQQAAVVRVQQQHKTTATNSHRFYDGANQNRDRTIGEVVELMNAQNSPEDYLEAHNTARAEVGVKPLKWDGRLESYAYLHLSQKTEHCIPFQSDGPYGENTVSGVKATGAFRKLTGVQAVGVWVAQKQYYDEKSNSCIGGYCGHYMQVVWRDTTHVGCARVQCDNGAYMVSCNYSPPGNLRDQRPY